MTLDPGSRGLLSRHSLIRIPFAWPSIVTHATSNRRWHFNPCLITPQRVFEEFRQFNKKLRHIYCTKTIVYLSKTTKIILGVANISNASVRLVVYKMKLCCNRDFQARTVGDSAFQVGGCILVPAALRVAEHASVGRKRYVCRKVHHFPHFLQIGNQGVHHFESVEWSGGQSKFLLAAGYGWVINRLQVVSKLFN